MRRSLKLLGLAALLIGSTAHAQDWAKEKLEKSPRHLEYVKVSVGDRSVTCLVAYPEIKEKATAVIVIHEIFGLSDWIKLTADELAEAGYIAIAPDLLSGMGKDGGGTETFKGTDDIRKAVMDLAPTTVDLALDSVSKYVTALPASNGKVAVSGFCWGGSQSFRYAAHNPDLKAAFVFYGTGPTDANSITDIKTPVYGFYGSNDARVNATIPQSEKLMKDAGKTYLPVTYEGAGHGFLRAGEAPDANQPNTEGRAKAWDRWKSILKAL